MVGSLPASTSFLPWVEMSRARKVVIVPPQIIIELEFLSKNSHGNLRGCLTDI